MKPPKIPALTQQIENRNPSLKRQTHRPIAAAKQPHLPNQQAPYSVTHPDLTRVNFQKAIEFQQQELIAAEFQDDWVKMGSLLLNLVTANSQCDRYSEAIELYGRLLTLCHDINSEEAERWVFQTMAFYGLATLYQKTGDHQQAVAYCDRALSISYETVQPITERCLLLREKLMKAIAPVPGQTKRTKNI